MNKYDHSQLKKGDLAAYGEYRNWGGWSIGKSKVDRLTATQIVLDNGMRFRRDTGRKVGDAYGVRLLDPKGSEVRDTIGALEASSFGHTMTQWDKERRAVRNLDSWQICLAQLESHVAEARRRARDLLQEWE